jgi:hypothetical protein
MLLEGENFQIYGKWFQTLAVEIWQESESPSYEILREKVQQIDGLVCLLTDRIDKELITQGPVLKSLTAIANDTLKQAAKVNTRENFALELAINEFSFF